MLWVLAGVSVALLIYEAWALAAGVLLPLLANPNALQTDFHYYYEAAVRQVTQPRDERRHDGCVGRRRHEQQRHPQRQIRERHERHNGRRWIGKAGDDVVREPIELRRIGAKAHRGLVVVVEIGLEGIGVREERQQDARR